MSWFGKQRIGREDFNTVIQNLARSLETLREEYIFGSLSQLKREGVDVSNVSRDIGPASELEAALIGFQLTSIIGIAWGYIKGIEDQLFFDHALSKHMNAEKGSRAWIYRERYTDCQGDMDALAKALSFDVQTGIGSPIPREEFLIQFQGGAYILAVLCQAATCAACGDSKMERKIKEKLRMV
jgi:hypothetical protein